MKDLLERLITFKTISHGSSDARYFAKANIPVLLVNPMGGAYHCENEWIDLDDLERYYAVFKQWAFSVAKKEAA